MVVADAMGVTGAGIFGDILCMRMVKRGVGALITDGVMRDKHGVIATGLPVWCAGVAAPASVNQLTFVGWNEPIGCGGCAIFPGDIIVADDDGAVVIPAALADFVANEGAEHELRKPGWCRKWKRVPSCPAFIRRMTRTRSATRSGRRSADVLHFIQDLPPSLASSWRTGADVATPSRSLPPACSAPISPRANGSGCPIPGPPPIINGKIVSLRPRRYPLSVRGDSCARVRVCVLVHHSGHAMPPLGGSAHGIQHPFHQCVVRAAGRQTAGLHPNWGEHVVTVVAVSIAVLIVATIAVLMGMA